MSVEDYARLAEQAEQVLQAGDTRTTKTKLDGFYLAAQDATERQERRAAEAAEEPTEIILVSTGSLRDRADARRECGCVVGVRATARHADVRG